LINYKKKVSFDSIESPWLNTFSDPSRPRIRDLLTKMFISATRTRFIKTFFILE